VIAFDPFYWRVILDTIGGKLMVALFLLDFFLIVESFARKSLWQDELIGLRKRLIVLRTSAVLLPVLGLSAYAFTLSRDFSLFGAIEVDFVEVLAAGIGRFLTTFFTGLWMGMLLLVYLAVLEIKVQSAKAVRSKNV